MYNETSTASLHHFRVCLLVRNRYSGAHPLLGCATSSRTLSCGTCIELSFAPSFLLPQCNLVESRHLSTLFGMPYTYEESRLRGPSLRCGPPDPLLLVNETTRAAWLCGSTLCSTSATSAPSALCRNASRPPGCCWTTSPVQVSALSSEREVPQAPGAHSAIFST